MSNVKDPTSTSFTVNPKSKIQNPKSVRASLRRVAFEALYGPFAWAYDWVSRTFFLGQWRVWQRAAIPHITGSRVLEIGMGTGDLQADLIRVGFEAWGIDFSQQMLRRAVLKARKRSIALRAARARAQALPFPDGTFDSVVSTFPSDYIGDPGTLNEITRVLRPGGRLVVVPGGWLHPRGSKGKFYEGVARLVYGEKGNTGASDRNPLEKYHNEAEWIKALSVRMKEAGFLVGAHIASNSKGAAIVIVANSQTEL